MGPHKMGSTLKNRSLLAADVNGTLGATLNRAVPEWE